MKCYYCEKDGTFEIKNMSLCESCFCSLRFEIKNKYKPCDHCKTFQLSEKLSPCRDCYNDSTLGYSRVCKNCYYGEDKCINCSYLCSYCNTGHKKIIMNYGVFFDIEENNFKLCSKCHSKICYDCRDKYGKICKQCKYSDLIPLTNIIN